MSQEFNSEFPRDELNEAFICSKSMLSDATSQQQLKQPSPKQPKRSWRDTNSQRPKKTKPTSELHQHSVKQSISRLCAELDQELVKTQSPRRQRRQQDQSSEQKSVVRPPTARTASVSKLKKRKVMVLNETVCSICLNPPQKETGKLPCSHLFCLECIEFWAQSSSRCPYCRKEYDQLLKGTGEIVHIEPKQPVFEDSQDYIYDPCYVCETFDDIPMLLLCDRCENKCCHINCDPRITGDIPDEWVCAFCEVAELETQLLDQPPSISADKEKQESSSEEQAVVMPIEDGKARYNLRSREVFRGFTRTRTNNISNPNTVSGRTRSKRQSQLLVSGDPLSRRMMRTRREFRRRRNM